MIVVPVANINLKPVSSISCAYGHTICCCCCCLSSRHSRIFQKKVPRNCEWSRLLAPIRTFTFDAHGTACLVMLIHQLLSLFKNHIQNRIYRICVYALHANYLWRERIKYWHTLTCVYV